MGVRIHMGNRFLRFVRPDVSLPCWIRPVGNFATSPQQCLKIVPYVGAVLVVFMLAFALWVSTIPPKTIPKQNPLQPEAQAENSPDLMREMMADAFKEKVEKAVKEREMKEAAEKKNTAQAAVDPEPIKAAREAEEIIEL